MQVLKMSMRIHLLVPCPLARETMHNNWYSPSASSGRHRPDGDANEDREARQEVQDTQMCT